MNIFIITTFIILILMGFILNSKMKDDLLAKGFKTHIFFFSYVDSVNYVKMIRKEKDSCFKGKCIKRLLLSIFLKVLSSLFIIFWFLYDLGILKKC